MRLTIEGVTLTGAAIDRRERRVDPDALVAAIRNEPSPYEVECERPGPVQERVGVVTEGMARPGRTAIALAARSRGLSAPQDDRIERLRADLAAVEVPPAPATPEAPPADDVARLRERVAALRGEVDAHTATDRDPTPVRERLREAAGRLAELETERAARAQASERLREVRDARERRLRLEDRVANAERAARAHLDDRLRPDVATALADLGAIGESSEDSENVPVDDPEDAPAEALALSILHVARIDAPVVLGVDRFPSPRVAAEWLDAPVIRL